MPCLAVGDASASAPALPSAIEDQIGFEPNRGQAGPRVRFLAHTSGGTTAVTDDGATFTLGGSTVGMTLAGASGRVRLSAGNRLPGAVTYLRRGVAARGVPRFGRVRRRGVYRGVDLVFHARRGPPEYDFVVTARGD